MPNVMAALPNIGGALCSKKAKFGLRPLLECRAVTLPRRETRWNLQGAPNIFGDMNRWGGCDIWRWGVYSHPVLPNRCNVSHVRCRKRSKSPASNININAWWHPVGKNITLMIKYTMFFAVTLVGWIGGSLSVYGRCNSKALRHTFKSVLCIGETQTGQQEWIGYLYTDEN